MEFDGKQEIITLLCKSNILNYSSVSHSITGGEGTLIVKKEVIETLSIV
jgi:hypothetical protein